MAKPSDSPIASAGLLAGASSAARLHQVAGISIAIDRHDLGEDNGTIILSYVFASQSGVLAPKPSILELSGQAGGWPHFRDEAGQHAFRTTGQLSEYLLVPVFTGRPR